jgi:hypothetical protein
MRSPKPDPPIDIEALDRRRAEFIAAADEPPGLYDEFCSTRCRCGVVSKARQTSFCGACWLALPNELQSTLAANFGDGYEEAFEAACRFLAKHPPDPFANNPLKGVL